jgi:hypothetical protein
MEVGLAIVCHGCHTGRCFMPLGFLVETAHLPVMDGLLLNGKYSHNVMLTVFRIAQAYCLSSVARLWEATSIPKIIVYQPDTLDMELYIRTPILESRLYDLNILSCCSHSTQTLFGQSFFSLCFPAKLSSLCVSELYHKLHLQLPASSTVVGQGWASEF